MGKLATRNDFYHANVTRTSRKITICYVTALHHALTSFGGNADYVPMSHLPDC